MPTSTASRSGAAKQARSSHTRPGKPEPAAPEAAAASVHAPREGAVGDLRGFKLGRIPKTAELIARELRRRIVTGELGEGAALPSEAELMTQLSVSRATLREALRILESETLVTVKRGSRGGPLVHRPNADLAAHYFGMVLQSDGTSVEDVFLARMLIEPPAVRTVVENAKRRVPTKLADIVEAARGTVQRGDGLAFGHQLARFHAAIIELTGNKTLQLIMRMLNIIYEHHMEAIAAAGPVFDTTAAARSGLKALERLLEFIVAGDADGAVAHWRSHLLKVKESMFSKDYVSELLDIV